MSVNGSSVKSRYDQANRVLVYTPEHPLAAGTYKVSCKVVVDDFMPVKKEWSFVVAAGATTALPAPNADQEHTVQLVNRIRADMGLPAYRIDSRLCAAAASHTAYLERNGLTGHYQRPGDPGFTGQTPADRMDSFGFAESSWEGVDYSSRTPEASIQRLFDAPYHRLPFMQPGMAAIGAGFVPSHMTVDFGVSEISGVVVSPAPDQRDIPLSWSAVERPDPLRVSGLHGVVGYPIVFSYFSPNNEKLRVKSASLETASGEKVPFGLNTPDNDDHLDFAAFLIPNKPLMPHTTYRVRVEARTASGDDVSKTWSFTTR